jgi:phospholipid/cholesterol/gamma-HCH transport system ATP-binding protein
VADRVPGRVIEPPGADGKPVPKVRIRGLCKRFGDHVVLSDLDLDIPACTNVALLGASGSGKTVLARCILGLVEPDSGSVEVDGREVARLRPREMESTLRKIGVLFQNNALFDSLPVWENVVFRLIHGDRMDAREAKPLAIDALAACGLGPDVAEILPAELSGGMSKRVALARAIVGAPEFLVLDSPTAGLDPMMTTIIGQLISRSVNRLNAGALMLTQDVGTARRIADRIAVLCDGRIIWEGAARAVDHAGVPYVERFIRGSHPGNVVTR